ISQWPITRKRGLSAPGYPTHGAGSFPFLDISLSSLTKFVYPHERKIGSCLRRVFYCQLPQGALALCFSAMLTRVDSIISSLPGLVCDDLNVIPSPHVLMNSSWMRFEAS